MQHLREAALLALLVLLKMLRLVLPAALALQINRRD